MKKETRFKFNGYLTQLAKLNGVSVSDIASKYTAEPSVAQTLETKIQESSSFLQQINKLMIQSFVFKGIFHNFLLYPNWL